MTYPLLTGVSEGSSQSRSRYAFTLIEVLVVVAIIALLAAVLLPSLQTARLQARNLTCQANAKQIATMASAYQAEYAGYVPVMYTHASATFVGGDSKAPARVGYLSLALRAYDKSTVGIRTKTNGYLDPDAHWDADRREEYEQRYLPDFYICPFERERGIRREVQNEAGTIVEFHGRREYYVTWMREDSVTMRGAPVPGYRNIKPNPERKGNGYVQYTATTWNRMNSIDTRFPDGTLVPPISGVVNLKVPQTEENTAIVANAHRQWSPGDMRRLRCASTSDVTVAYCAKGEYYDGNGKEANPGSHRGASGGGTMGIFADSHVTWVKGSQFVGW